MSTTIVLPANPSATLVKLFNRIKKIQDADAAEVAARKAAIAEEIKQKKELAAIAMAARIKGRRPTYALNSVVFNEFMRMPQINLHRTHGRTTQTERAAILRLVCGGIPMKSIAERFDVSTHTVYLYSKQFDPKANRAKKK